MMTEKQVSANLRSYYLSRIDWIALIVVGVIAIWVEHGLGLAEILLLQGIFGFGIMVLEYPSGVLADLTSRRKIIIIAMLSNIIGVSIYIIADNFFLFVVAELFFAISLSSKSGADNAHIYDTYLEKEQNNRADEIIANGRSLRFAAIMILTAISGVLVAIDWRLPFIIASFGYLCTAISYMRSYEPERLKVENSKAAVKASLSYLKNIRIIKLSLMLLFLLIFLRVSFWDYIPKLEGLGVSTVWFGLVLSAANAIAFISSLLVRKYKNLINYDIVYVIVGISGLILFMNQSSLYIVLFAIILHQLYRGGAQVVFDIKLNQQVDSSVRASIISLISAGIQGLFFVLIAVFNLLELSNSGIHKLNAIMGGIVVVLIVFLSILESKYADKVLSKDEIEEFPLDRNSSKYPDIELSQIGD